MIVKSFKSDKIIRGERLDKYSSTIYLCLPFWQVMFTFYINEISLSCIYVQFVSWLIHNLVGLNKINVPLNDPPVDLLEYNL